MNGREERKNEKERCHPYTFPPHNKSHSPLNLMLLPLLLLLELYGSGQTDSFFIDLFQPALHY